MKKGISIWSFGGRKFEESFALAKRAGFDGVEIDLSEDGELSYTTSEREIAGIKRAADNSGIELYSVASGLYWKYSLTDNDSAMRAKAEATVRRQIDVASALNCDTILVVPGAVSVSFAPELGVVDYSTAYNRSAEALTRLAPHAAAAKVSIGIENVWNNFLLSPLEMKGLIDLVGSEYVGSYFDVGNVLYSGYPEQWIKILGSRIKKVHFKDYRRSVGGLDGFVDLLAGDVDYRAVMSALQSVGYNGWVTGEMIPPYAQHGDAIIYNTSTSMDYIIGRTK